MLPNGAAEHLIDGGLEALRDVVTGWRERVIDAIAAARNLDDVPRAVLVAVDQLPTEELARGVWRVRMHTVMLGALDSAWEIQTEREVEPQLADRSGAAIVLAGADGAAGGGGGISIGGFTSKPFDEALELFRDRQIFTRHEWALLDREQRQNAFFVSGLAKRDTIKLVHDELVTSLQEGVKVSEFKDRIRTAFEERGLSPLSDAHAETIVRTNIATAYGDGRRAQQSSEVVTQTHPYWLISGVSDRTTRATHRAVHGISLPATDAFWQRAYPPFGFRCRCRVTARRKGDDAPSSAYPALAELPDEGFGT